MTPVLPGKRQGVSGKKTTGAEQKRIGEVKCIGVSNERTSKVHCKGSQRADV